MTRNAPTNPDAAAALAKLLARRIDPSLANLDAAQIESLLAQPVWTETASGPATQHADWQDRIIESLVPQAASVLDLGCGNGELLAKLIAHKKVRGQGVELDPAAVFQSVAKGVPVFQSDLDAGLKGFANQSFDCVVLEQTLQTLRRPVELLREMLRVGRRSIVSFPNFAFWQIRFDLALRGRMPVTPRLPRPWYDTPNIHLLTLQDFLDWTHSNRVHIVEAHVLADGTVRNMRDGDNLYAEEALLVVENS